MVPHTPTKLQTKALKKSVELYYACFSGILVFLFCFLGGGVLFFVLFFVQSTFF